MRPLLVASVVLALIAGSACEHCSCSATKRAIQVLLTDTDAGTVIGIGLGQAVGVELGGSGRMISASDPMRLQSLDVPLQPEGETLGVFVPASARRGQLVTYGGTEVLSAPAQGSHPAWQVFLIIDTHQAGFSLPSVVTVGQSWTYTWPVGGEAPRSSNTKVAAPTAPAERVTRAWEDFRSNNIAIDGAYLQQMFYAVATGTVVMSEPFPGPSPTTEVKGNTRQVTVNLNPDLMCSVESGCTQTHFESQTPSP